MKAIETRIEETLCEIEEKEGVRILHAVESGSRAWGFASPDSDYDVRFVYVRPQAEYLRLDEPRDVIEWQLDEVLDINGWDLKKALRFAHCVSQLNGLAEHPPSVGAVFFGKIGGISLLRHSQQHAAGISDRGHRAL